MEIVNLVDLDREHLNQKSSRLAQEQELEQKELDKWLHLSRLVNKSKAFKGIVEGYDAFNRGNIDGLWGCWKHKIGLLTWRSIACFSVSTGFGSHEAGMRMLSSEITVTLSEEATDVLSDFAQCLEDAATKAGVCVKIEVRSKEVFNKRMLNLSHLEKQIFSSSNV